MLDYTDEQIKSELETILGIKDFSIKPVGNHHLKRHLVYQIDMKYGENTYLNSTTETGKECKCAEGAS